MTTNLYISICTNNFFFSLLLNYLQSIYFLNIFRFAECGYTWELCFTSSQILDCKIRILIWQCGGATTVGVKELSGFLLGGNPRETSFLDLMVEMVEKEKIRWVEGSFLFWGRQTYIACKLYCPVY